MKRLRGFTIVELMVVIAVIGILTTITIVGYARYQANARDSQRTAKISSLAEALEKYYDQNGEYPSCDQLTQSISVVTGTGGALQGVDQDALKSPNASANSIQCADLTSVSGPDYFAYVGDGSTDCSGSGSCLSFTLKYKDEADGIIKSVASRHVASISTSSIPTLSGTVAGTTATLTWTAATNGTTYGLDRATSSDFQTGLTTVSNIAALTYDSTGLTSLGSTYYFRVYATTGGVSGGYSNTIAIQTPPAAPTGLALTVNSGSQITATWSAASGATSYKMEYATNSAFTGATTVSGITGTSQAMTGLLNLTTYYVRVSSTAGGATSSPSAPQNATTSLDAPAPYSVSASGSNALYATSNAICGSGATPNYYWYANGSPWVSGDQYQSVGYSLSYGQGITLSVNTRCYSGTTYSGYTAGSNAPGYTYATPAPYLNGLSVGSGRRVTTSFSAICGGLNEMLLQQGSYTDTSSQRFALPNNYGTTDARTWQSSGLVRYHVRTTCNGYTSDWSNEQDASV